MVLALEGVAEGVYGIASTVGSRPLLTCMRGEGVPSYRAGSGLVGTDLGRLDKIEAQENQIKKNRAVCTIARARAERRDLGNATKITRKRASDDGEDRPS